jgi:2-polyprenyl-3-methyl-5-hydroxy-6-metoxy-1,4-benzoquinol methylase
MTHDALHKFYEEKYKDEVSARDIPAIKTVKVPVDRFQAAVKFVPKLFKGGDILEIGAGGGEIAHALLASDLSINKYTITDLSPSRIDGVRARLNDRRVDTVVFDVENAQSYPESSYDAIIMVALIEHLIDPIAAMRHLRQKIKPGGFVYIDTPNIAKYTQRLRLLAGRFPSTASRNEGLTTFYGKPAALFDEGHLHYFTYRSLANMLTGHCGYTRVVKLGYPGGRRVFGDKVHGALATRWPEMFAEIALAAYV